MNFQRHLFNPDRIKGHKYLKKMARPVSMLLALCSVIGVIALVMLVLIPQLGDTFVNLGRNIQAFIPRLQEWATSIFRDNPDIVSWTRTGWNLTGIRLWIRDSAFLHAEPEMF